MLGKNLNRQYFAIFLLFQRIGIEISCKLSSFETISMKCQSLVSGKKKTKKKKQKKKKKKKKKQQTNRTKKQNTKQTNKQTKKSKQKNTHTKKQTYITNLLSVEFTQRDWIHILDFSFKYYKVAPLFMASVCFSCPQIPF